MPVFQRYLWRSIVLLLLINVAGLWTVNFLQYRQVQRLQMQHSATQAQLDQVSAEILGVVPTTSAPLPDRVTATTTSSDQAVQAASTLKEVLRSLAELTDRVTGLEAKPTASAQPSSSGQSKASSAVDREVVIFMGTGSNPDLNWVNVSGASVYLNPADYPGLYGVKFEAALGILGGEASARLVNTTTGAIYYQSLVVHNNSTATWKMSPLFALPAQPATYQVQVRSSSGERVELTGARLRLQLR